MAIGVDSDQYKTADPTVKDVIMTSMLKRVDVAVYDFINARSTTATSPPAPDVFDLKKDGVGYSTSGGQIDDIKTKLEALQGRRSSTGEITVPTE